MLAGRVGTQVHLLLGRDLMRRLPALILSGVCRHSSQPLAQEGTDPFAFFSPSVVTSRADRQQLDKGGTLARVVPGQRHAIAIFSATPLDASGDRLIGWIHNIAALKQSAYVQAIGRFSSPPQLAD